MQLIHGTDPNVLEAIYATQNSRCFVLLFLLTKLAISSCAQNQKSAFSNTFLSHEYSILGIITTSLYQVNENPHQQQSTVQC